MRKHEVTLELLRGCPNNCVYCSSRSTPNFEGKLSGPHITLIKDFIRESISLGFNHFNLSGGEPLLYSGVIDVIEYIKSFESKPSVTIYTSGLHIENPTGFVHPSEYLPIPLDKFIKIKTFLLSAEDKVIFNMQTMQDSNHSNITGIQQTQTNRDLSIKHALAAGLNVEINLVPMHINLHLISSTVEKAIGLGCTKVNLLKLVNQGNALNHNKLQLTTEDEQVLMGVIKSLQSNYPNIIRVGTPLSKEVTNACGAGVFKIVLSVNQEVLPCEAFKHLQTNVAYTPEVYKTYGDLERIINTSSFFMDIMQYIKSCKNSNCDNCPGQQLLNTTNSSSILDTHFRSILATKQSDAFIENTALSNVSEQHKDSICINNYLVLHKGILKYDHLVTVLATKQKDILGLTPHPVNITKDEFLSIIRGSLFNLFNHSYLASEDSGYILYFAPTLMNSLISMEVIERFMDSCFSTVHTPTACNKTSIIISQPDNTLLNNFLSSRGFTKVSKNSLYYAWVYITSGIIHSDNILNLAMEVLDNVSDNC